MTVRILFAVHREKIRVDEPFVEALNLEGIETLVVPSRKTYAFAERRFLSEIPFPRLLRLIRSFEPDLVFVDYPYYSVCFTELLKRLMIVHLRGDFWLELQARAHYSTGYYWKLVSNWRKIVMERAIKKAAMVCPVSKWLSKRVEKRIPGIKTHVLYKAIPKDYWSQCKPVNLPILEHPAIVSTIDFDIYPKLYGLIRLMPLMKELTKVHFYLAGDGYWSSLIKKVKPPNVRLLGHLSRSEVRQLLKECDMFIHPSALDAFPKSIIEAALLEKPIIASNVGGIPEIILNNVTGYLCSLRDTKAWKEKIQFLLDNPSVGKRLGREAKQRIEKQLSPKRIAKEFIRAVSFILH